MHKPPDPAKLKRVKEKGVPEFLWRSVPDGEGVEKGEVRRDMSPGRLYQYITGVYVYGMLNWLADPDFSVANELRLASRFIESALLEADGRKTPAR